MKIFGGHGPPALCRCFACFLELGSTVARNQCTVSPSGGEAALECADCWPCDRLLAEQQHGVVLSGNHKERDHIMVAIMI